MAVRKVHVPQADGEIVLTANGTDRRVFVVSDHHVSPASNAERDELLRLVDGAKLAKAEAPPASTNSGSGTPAVAGPKG